MALKGVRSFSAFFYDIALSPWADIGRIYASRGLSMSDANKNRTRAMPKAAQEA